VRSEITSYRQLPLNLYQIQAKYRDEARPRYGLMRSREFIMKDAYSFDRDAEGLDASYARMREAYTKIFSRCGLSFRPVEADSGAIGGKDSEEFTALCEYGESDIAYCDVCDMAATTDRAATPDAAPSAEAELPLSEASTPGAKTIDEVAAFLGLPKEKTLKALLFEIYEDREDYPVGEYIAVFIRGDRELNEVKLRNALGGIPEHLIAFADEAALGKRTGAVGGFTGPVGLKNCRIVVDSEIPGLKNLCAGANKPDAHLLNVNYGRDYEADIITDLKLVRSGDPCPVCGAPLKTARGIEVGQIFKLGTKYSESMGAVYKDENQEDRLIVMGCYGIGVTRTMAAVVEQNHDEKGPVWPMSIAPYHAIITLVKPDDPVQAELAEKLYTELNARGVETMLDDRDERPGVKFNDADIFGIPLRLTVGKKAGEGVVEYKLRRGGEVLEYGSGEAIAAAAKLVADETRGGRDAG
jgi:prolyl-tRNA synthetase